MRPLMRLGGMVASGGPYAIAHPAPHWVALPIEPRRSRYEQNRFVTSVGQYWAGI
jgi:hypothetical protein